MKTITILHFYRRADGNTLLIRLIDTWWQHGWPVDHNAVDPPFVCAAPTLDVPRTRLSSPACTSYALPFRFITKSIHAYLIDYPVAIVLMVAPFLLKLGKSSPVALCFRW